MNIIIALESVKFKSFKVKNHVECDWDTLVDTLQTKPPKNTFWSFTVNTFDGKALDADRLIKANELLLPTGSQLEERSDGKGGFFYGSIKYRKSCVAPF